MMMDMDKNIDVTLTVNGEQVSRRIPARTNLVDFVRYDNILFF